MHIDRIATWDRRAARKGELDGQFLVGSLTAGTYSLPSCTEVARRRAQLAVFASEAMAKAAGLRPCKVCRPERFYAGRGDGLAQFEQLAALTSTAPSAVPTIDALARHINATVPQLEVLLGDHAHATASDWLERARVRFAARLLLTTRASSDAVMSSAGFDHPKDYKRAFLEAMRMTPENYRGLGSRDAFHLELPSDYRAAVVLAYQGRDSEGLAERSDARRVFKALSTTDGPAILEIVFGLRKANVRVHSTRKLGRESYAKLHRDALKILGLQGNIRDFETSHPKLVGSRSGLRVPLIPSAFDALCWAIVGQQINVSFAGSLRRELILLAGERVGDMMVHPTPDTIAALNPSDLTSRRFSRSKTKYLIDTARAISEGQLAIESLVDGSAVKAEALLTAQHGIGTWTARYVMMRTGFADAAPVGDSGLATALQRMHSLPERPDANATARMMAEYSPWRSLASMHLWASL